MLAARSTSITVLTLVLGLGITAGCGAGPRSVEPPVERPVEPSVERPVEPSTAAPTPHAAPHPSAAGGAQKSGWIAAWAAAPVAAVTDAASRPATTARNLVRLSVGGNRVRIRLSNAFGTHALTVDHAAVAVAAGPSSARSVSGTTRTIRFDGKTATTVAAGSDRISDAVRLDANAGSTLQVSTYVADPHGSLTTHPFTLQTSYLATGDHVDATSATPFTATTPAWHLVTEVAVHAAPARGTVVAFGDSITEGAASTAGANGRWPDILAQRLAASHRGVVAAAISGNRLLRDSPTGTDGMFGKAGLTRFDRDVLARTGIRSVVVLEGVNDLQIDPSSATVASLVEGLHRLVDRARAAQVRVVCGTILPFGRWTSWNPAKESVRVGVNAAIRGGLCDAAVDFDRLLRDPGDPGRMSATYDSGDGLHPNDAGHLRMGEAIPLAAL